MHRESFPVNGVFCAQPRKFSPSKVLPYTVQYLGHVIEGGKVRPDPQKLEAVNNYPKPVSKKDVRTFLGLTSYYRRFMSHFTTIVETLAELTKGRVDQRQKPRPSKME